MGHRIERIVLVSPAPGTARTVTAHRFGTEGARPKAYLHGSLHADELPGMLCLSHLISALMDADRANGIVGEIVVVPVANPIGLAQAVNGSLSGRYALDGAGNFNRNWPDLAPAILASVGGSLSPADPDANVARIRRAAREAVDGFAASSEIASLRKALLSLSVDADIVLDVHCDLEALLHLYVGQSVWPALADLSAEIGSRATLTADDSGGGPFDECVGGLWWRLAQARPGTALPPACHAATIELRGQADTSDQLAAQDADSLLRFLQRRGVIGGDPPPLPAPLCEATRLDATDVVHAPIAGVICYKVELGEVVAAGDIVAEILDPTADDPARARTPVRTLANGLVLTRQVSKFARAGDAIAKVVGRETLPTRQAGALMEAR